MSKHPITGSDAAFFRGRKQSRFAGVLFGCLLAACVSPDEAEPGSLRVDAVLSGGPPSELPEGEYRLAVLWVSEGGTSFFAAEDRSVRITEKSHSIEFEVPNVARSRLFPLEQVFLGERAHWRGTGSELADRSVLAPAYRPRVVVYLDSNENRRFDAPTLARPGDRLVAIEIDSPVAALLDPKGDIGALSLEAAEALYRSNPEFRHFVFVDGLQSLSLAEPTSIALLPVDSDVGWASLRCGRAVTTSLPTTELRVHVDRSLDSFSLCPLIRGSCSAEGFEEVSPPLLESEESDEVSLEAQCRQRDGVDALVRKQSTTACELCTCGSQQVVDSYLVRTSSAPSWWPCGTTVPYCESVEEPLTVFALTCSSPDGGVAPLHDGGSSFSFDASLEQR